VLLVFFLPRGIVPRLNALAASRRSEPAAPAPRA